MAPGGSAGAPQTILVYSVEDISGDGLIKLPFLAGLRAAFPHAQISWCAATGSSVYAGWLKPVAAGLIDEMVLEGRPGLERFDWIAPGRPLGGRRFDLVIDTQSNVARTLAMRRVGRRFVSPAAGFALSERRPAVWPKRMIAQLETLLKLAAGEGAALAPVNIADPETRAAAERLLPPGPTYVGFGPGAGGPERRWPLDRYIELARRQDARGRVPVFVLGPAERDYVPVLQAEAPFARLPTEDAAAPGGPILTIALAARMRAAVAADAGPGHMLAAGGAPLVSLFRERRKAEKFLPAAPRVEALIAEDWGEKAIDLIPTDAVDQALERLLG